MKKPSLSELSLREKIGQCILIKPRWLYLQPDVSEGCVQHTKEEIDSIIEKEPYGSLWTECTDAYIVKNQQKSENELKDDIFEPDSVNPYWQVMSTPYKTWIDEERKRFKIPPLNTGDFTPGGGKKFRDLSVVSGQITVGAANSTELAFELGASIARELRCAGINWRWSPVIDITNRFTHSVCRTYAQNDIDRVVTLANAQIKGVQSEGVAATAKHFPGADRKEYRDSHYCPTVNNSSIEEWWEEQGAIFQGVIDGGVYTIMSTHTAFPAVDDTKIGEQYIPSTLSKKVITDLLKEKMGFEGVVISDDVQMGGLRSIVDYETMVIMAINAGNDVLLNCEPGTVAILEKAVKDGRISEDRINDACQRVLDLKEKIGLFDDNYNDLPYTSDDATTKTLEIDTKITEKSITLLYDKNNILPLNKQKHKNIMIVASSHSEAFETDLEFFKSELENRGAKVDIQRRISSYAEMDKIAEKYDLIIYAAYITFGVPAGMPFLFDKECHTYFYAFSKGKEKSIGISFGYPYVHYDVMGNAPTFINAYSNTKPVMKALSKALYGEITFEGTSPVDLDNCAMYK